MDYADKFHRDWSDDPEMVSLCSSILALLLSATKQDHYSFLKFKQELGAENDKKLAVALNYLCAPSLRILSTIFFVEDGDHILEISQEDLNFDDQGNFFHPVTGDLLPEDELLLGFERGPSIENGGVPKQ